MFVKKWKSESNSHVKPIIGRARDRLNETFNVNLSLPTPTLEPGDIKFAKPRVNSHTKPVDQGYEDKVVE